MAKTLLCTFWSEGRCTKGSACNYAHGEDEQRAACHVTPCRFHHDGRCKQGSACWFSHADVESPSPKAKVGTASKAFTVKGAKRGAKLSISVQNPTTEGPRDAAIKTLLCNFWSEGRCTKGSACNYAHGEDEQRAACRATPCRFFHDGGCKQGSACWFSHVDAANSSSSTASTTASSPRTPVPDVIGEVAKLSPYFDEPIVLLPPPGLCQQSAVCFFPPPGLDEPPM